MEDPRVGHRPDELAETEDGQGEGRGSLDEVAQPLRRGIVSGRLTTVGVDEHVRVDGDHRRSSRRS
jgi:hypothetical protein